MRFEIITIFPEFFTSFFENGILRRALAEGLVSVCVHDLRAFTHDRHRTVDDRPFGGGEGMVLKPGPLAEAMTALGIAPKSERMTVEFPPSTFQELGVKGTGFQEKGTGFSPYIEAANEQGTFQAAEKLDKEPEASGHDFSRADNDHRNSRALAPAECSTGNSEHAPKTRVILLSAQGKTFTQAIARSLAKEERVVLICGRYEGIDERINELYCDLELSIGDYVLSGGELAAAVVVDATMRLLPGVLGNEASSEFESFGVADAEITTDEEGVPRSQHGAGGLLDYPHYTRPAEFGGLRVPETLLNGDHKEIRKWRREQQLRKTLANRPDLLAGAALSKEDEKLLEAIRGKSE
ncbi:MAG: tRNA (guanine(37)-N(1))-methyltransferase [Terracidiphilus sp.]